MAIKLTHTYENIISLDNLLEAWREFVRGKRKRKDVQEFELRLMDNVLALHKDLREKTYCHPAHCLSDVRLQKIRLYFMCDRKSPSTSYQVFSLF